LNEAKEQNKKNKNKKKQKKSNTLFKAKCRENESLQRSTFLSYEDYTAGKCAEKARVSNRSGLCIGQPEFRLGWGLRIRI
jgi:hypothetical protein